MPNILKLVMFLFFAVMAIVTLIAYSKPGHPTELNTLEIQKLRTAANRQR